jgi:hypothetical protein
MKCQPRPESKLAFRWLRGWDLNPRPPGYEPDELPDCSTPRHCRELFSRTARAIVSQCGAHVKPFWEDFRNSASRRSHTASRPVGSGQIVAAARPTHLSACARPATEKIQPGIPDFRDVSIIVSSPKLSPGRRIFPGSDCPRAHTASRPVGSGQIVAAARPTYLSACARPAIEKYSPEFRIFEMFL